MTENAPNEVGRTPRRRPTSSAAANASGFSATQPSPSTLSAFDAIANSARLYTRTAVLASPSPVPAQPGIYAWYFREAPPGVPLDGCLRREGATLLYLGISPSSTNSSSTLRRRLRSHYSGNASGSTLRRSLGCLLGLRLRQVRTRLTFGEDEAELNRWLSDNALVCWIERPRPWEIEQALIHRARTPLNIEHSLHPFARDLSAMRRAANQNARAIQGD